MGGWGLRKKTFCKIFCLTKQLVERLGVSKNKIKATEREGKKIAVSTLRYCSSAAETSHTALSANYLYFHELGR